MTAERVTYLDSSAIVKLVVQEPESASLSRYLRRRGPLVSSALARVEVHRACMPLGSAARARVRQVLDRIELVRIGERVLAIASVIGPDDIRSFDAVHLATASLFESTLSAVVTYDRRTREAARALGVRTVSPG